MRFKAFCVLTLIIFIEFFNICPSSAMDRSDPTSEKYLLQHGHSQDIVRMINIQRSRLEDDFVMEEKTDSKFKKFLKNIWFEKDLTMPLNDFGYSDIKTVETDSFNNYFFPASNKEK